MSEFEEMLVFVIGILSIYVVSIYMGTCLLSKMENEKLQKVSTFLEYHKMHIVGNVTFLALVVAIFYFTVCKYVFDADDTGMNIPFIGNSQLPSFYKV